MHEVDERGQTYCAYGGHFGDEPNDVDQRCKSTMQISAAVAWSVPTRNRIQVESNWVSI